MAIKKKDIKKLKTALGILGDEKLIDATKNKAWYAKAWDAMGTAWDNKGKIFTGIAGTLGIGAGGTYLYNHSGENSGAAGGAKAAFEDFFKDIPVGPGTAIGGVALAVLGKAVFGDWLVAGALGVLGAGGGQYVLNAVTDLFKGKKDATPNAPGASKQQGQGTAPAPEKGASQEQEQQQEQAPPSGTAPDANVSLRDPLPSPVTPANTKPVPQKNVSASANLA